MGNGIVIVVVIAGGRDVETPFFLFHIFFPRLIVGCSIKNVQF